MNESGNESKNENKQVEDYDTIVVGCGVSGLFTGLALAKEGKRVLMLEKAPYVGGICRSYEVDGFVVDTGPHAITGLREGPIQLLIDAYFDMVPKFVESGDYFIRFHNGVYAAPLTIPEMLSFSPFSIEDRLNIVRGFLDLFANYVSGRSLENETVADYAKNYVLSETMLKFIDCICLFLTGVSMEKTPLSRILTGGRSKSESSVSKIRSYLFEGGKVHHYPRGGIKSIVDALMYSLPRNAEVHTDEEVVRIMTDNGRVCGVATNKAEYRTTMVVYAGANKFLPDLMELPVDYAKKLRDIEQVRTLTIWMGLDKKYIDRTGSEIWFETEKPCWLIPTSNLDPSLAPKGGQVIGFTFIISEDEAMAEGYGGGNYTDDCIDDYIKVIEEVFPDIREHLKMFHYQVLIPEQAANSKNNFFSGVKLPIEGMYAVGTDVDKRSMGITRAAHSVVSLLDLLKKEGFLEREKIDRLPPHPHTPR
ncbi:MAG: phytoene desaturase family protein [Methermicoccaceae archaeon]